MVLAAVNPPDFVHKGMSSLWRMLADVTYPIVAYTTVGQMFSNLLFSFIFLIIFTKGHAFNRTIYKVKPHSLLKADLAFEIRN
jgi:hypothetical protein